MIRDASSEVREGGGLGAFCRDDSLSAAEAARRAWVGDDLVPSGDLVRDGLCAADAAFIAWAVEFVKLASAEEMASGAVSCSKPTLTEFQMEDTCSRRRAKCGRCARGNFLRRATFTDT